MPQPEPGPPSLTARLGRRIALVLLLLAGMAGAAWFAWWRPIDVVLVAATSGPAIEAVYATGVVEAIDTARVGTIVAGRIVALAVDEGATVAAGDLLAQLDDRQPRQQLEDARSRLTMAELELQRGQELVGRGARSRQQVERDTEARDSAQAAVAIATRQLAEYRIAAPIAGVVMKRPVEAGETVGANAVLFEIASPARLRVAADVDERDIAQVGLGARMAIRVEAFPRKVVEAKVTKIRRQGDTATRTFHIEADLAADTGLLIGMTADVNVIVAERQDAVLVPPGALRFGPPQGGRPGAASVFQAMGDRAVQRPVETGAAGPERVEIRSGLAAGAEIIMPLPAGLADGTRIRVRH